MSDDDNSRSPIDPSDIDAELAFMARMAGNISGDTDPPAGDASEPDAEEETILVFSENGVEGVFTEEEVEAAATLAGDPDAMDEADPDVPTGWQQTQATAAKRVPPGPKPPGQVNKVSRAVSFLATGAMVTVLVLWATGIFDVPSIRDIVGEQRASESPDSTNQGAPLTGAEVAGDTSPEPPADGGFQRGEPSFIEIPAIGVRAGVIPLNTLPTGDLEVPTDFSQTGWWEGGPEPGELGPAVIAGHIDSLNGPAVFYGLEELVFDDAITITRGDGSSAVFAVRSTLNVTKNEFPSALVYGDTADAQLRLITCDGGFAEGSYTGNLIITAELIVERPAPDSGLLF